MIQLRPHHLLCIQNYTGHGYDEAFTEHMNQVTDLLGKDPEHIIRISRGCDEICSACPNREKVAADNDEGQIDQAAFLCSSPDKVENMDSAVMQICGFEDGKEYEWQTASQKANSLILQTELFGKVCGACSWYELCESTVRHQ